MNAAEYLASLSAVPLSIRWHENTRRLISYKRERKGLHLRLHRLFEAAPAVVLNALYRFVVNQDESAKAILRRAVHLYIEEHRVGGETLNPAGQTYDLREIYEKLKECFFSPEYDAAIGWSDVLRPGKFRHMTFGTYNRHKHQIRIHPLLDSPEVPLYFVEFIVYHEMLHAVCETQIDARGHCRCHTREFRRRERLFPQYAEAKSWEKNSLKFFKRQSHGRS